MALVTLFDPQCVQKLDAFGLAQVFGLTLIEARVAVLLAGALRANEIAHQQGGMYTRQVLGYLGAARMTDAVRVLNLSEAPWARTGRRA